MLVFRVHGKGCIARPHTHSVRTAPPLPPPPGTPRGPAACTHLAPRRGRRRATAAARLLCPWRHRRGGGLGGLGRSSGRRRRAGQAGLAAERVHYVRQGCGRIQHTLHGLGGSGAWDVAGLLAVGVLHDPGVTHAVSVGALRAAAGGLRVLRGEGGRTCGGQDRGGSAAQRARCWLVCGMQSWGKAAAPAAGVRCRRHDAGCVPTHITPDPQGSHTVLDDGPSAAGSPDPHHPLTHITSLAPSPPFPPPRGLT